MGFTHTGRFGFCCVSVGEPFGPSFRTVRCQVRRTHADGQARKLRRRASPTAGASSIQRRGRRHPEPTSRQESFPARLPKGPGAPPATEGCPSLPARASGASGPAAGGVVRRSWRASRGWTWPSSTCRIGDGLRTLPGRGATSGEGNAHIRQRPGFARCAAPICQVAHPYGGRDFRPVARPAPKGVPPGSCHSGSAFPAKADHRTSRNGNGPQGRGRTRPCVPGRVGVDSASALP